MATTKTGAKAGAKKGSSKEPKTQLNSASVPAFLARLAADRVADAKTIVGMMEKATGQKAAMWGDAIVGCGTYAVKYADGHESPWPLVAMSPRKSAFALYIGWHKHADLLETIGKHKTAGGCIHIKTLADVNATALQKLITAAARSRKAAGK